jgi:hypothetical protein
MKIYADIYSWDGKKTDHQEPVAWFPGSYHLKIFDVRDGISGVEPLKPYICISAETGKGMSISAKPEKFVKKICSDFDLEMEKVLWVEELGASSGTYEVVVFTRSGKLGEVVLYSISKRAPMPGELKIIEKELTALENTEHMS